MFTHCTWNQSIYILQLIKDVRIRTERRLVDEFSRVEPTRLKWQRASSNLLAFNMWTAADFAVQRNRTIDLRKIEVMCMDLIWNLSPLEMTKLKMLNLLIKFRKLSVQMLQMIFSNEQLFLFFTVVLYNNMFSIMLISTKQLRKTSYYSEWLHGKDVVSGWVVTYSFEHSYACIPTRLTTHLVSTSSLYHYPWFSLACILQP